MSVAGRFISSSLKIDSNNDRTAATSFAFDVAGFFQSEQTAFNDFDGRYRIGFNFQNLGPKITEVSANELKEKGIITPMDVKVVIMNHEDLEFVPEGLKITIKRSKTDQSV